MKRIFIATILALAVAIPAFAQDDTVRVAPDASLKAKAEKGWFFYEQAPKPAENKSADAPPPPETPKPPKADKADKDPCQDASTWTSSCGFVNPGKNFDFQAKERDVLLNNMSISNNDPKAVEAFQYYMRWVMGRAAEVANEWYYNTVQNPELDANVNQPISSFGLRLMTDVKSGKAKEIFDALKADDATLIYFSRTDCEFCHAMAATARIASKKTGLPLIDASLDSQCLEGFTSDTCISGDDVLIPAQKLQVTIVPTIFLKIKPDTWIRVSTGVTDESTIESRLVSFFSAYRSALLKGVSNGKNGAPSVDFSDPDSGVTGNQAGVASQKKVPTDDDVMKMLGK